ncbi:unnamed protein product [Schistosoma margrebowiei]|uniref:Saposin B-type domain-containing protein n=1 Tax=Schistosoma margrebowiei TaxID=48269 RepID=A0AA84ZZI7_9TREM|nr:unnamed protein product [Schistosoma margrebowiei]
MVIKMTIVLYNTITIMFNRQFQFIITLLIFLSYIKGFTMHNEYLQNENLLNLCGRCNRTIAKVINDLSDLDFQLKWEMKLVNGCKYTGPLRDNCASLFSSTMIKFINKFIVNMKPDKVCKNIFLCSI